MKFIHLSDLHLGKRLHEVNLLEDQAYILQQILEITRQEAPQAVVIAGDVYDKSVPSVEAVQLLDSFLSQLAKERVPTLVLSGNHDSPERIAFGSRLMQASGIYLSPVYQGTVSPIVLEDAFGKVNFYLLPFVKPAQVRRFFPEKTIESYTDAMAAAIEQMGIDRAQRNVLVCHQFVTGAQRSDSEDISVGGLDNVDASALEGFDYAALGHIHRSQCVERETIRYCGTPLKYSFSEADQAKSVTVVELGEKGTPAIIRTVPLTPKHDLREIRGSYLEVTAKVNYENTDTQDYLHITLTDEEDIPDAMGKLRVIYPNLLKLDYDNRRTRSTNEVTGARQVEQKSPLELFEEFYQLQNNQPFTPQQRALVKEIMESIWEGQV